MKVREPKRLKTTESHKKTASGKATGAGVGKKKDLTACVDDLVACCDCDCLIMEDTKALQCDQCDVIWKCIKCIGMTSEVYDMLSTGDAAKLLWFCDKCTSLTKKPSMPAQPTSNKDDRLDDICGKLDLLLNKFKDVETSLEEKVGKEDMLKIEERMKGMELRLEKMENNMLEVTTKKKDLEDEVQQLKTSCKVEDRKIKDCIELALDVKAQEEETEAEEREKRKTSVIIHGVSESSSTSPREREEDDMGVMASMLHEMKCGEAKVMKVIRLGKRPVADQGDADKARPIKMIMENEEAKIRVLIAAKNLRLCKEGGWERIFIHQDLTIKEREERKQLLKELKERKEKGESDLIMVRGKIVKKRVNNLQPVLIRNVSTDGSACTQTQIA